MAAAMLSDLISIDGKGGRGRREGERERERERGRYDRVSYENESVFARSNHHNNIIFNGFTY